MNIVIWSFVILSVINALTYLSFKLDKTLAIEGAWRIPEKTLLAQALIGGSLGAKLAQRRYRHKTRKQPFASLLNLICGLHIVGLIGFVAWATGAAHALNLVAR